MQRGYFWRGDNNESTGGIWYRHAGIRAEPGDDSGAECGLAEQPQLQPRHLRPGPVDHESPDAERRHHGSTCRTSPPPTSRRSRTAGCPTATSFYPAVKNVPNWKDINPRLSVAYDLFGTGKTALKASASRGVEQDSIRYAAANNPANTLVTQVSRTWNDTNNNFTPDCDLLNPQPNGECLVWQDLGFGSSRVTTFYDPRMLEGWGVRGYNWEFSGGVQHEIIPRLSASVGYFRRIYGNFNLQDNEALSRFRLHGVQRRRSDRRASGAVGTDDRRHLRPEPCRREPQRHQACIRLRRREIALERSGLLDRYAAPERDPAAGWCQHRQDDERFLRRHRRSARGAFSRLPPRRGFCWSESAHRRPRGRQRDSVTRRRRSLPSTKRLAPIRCRTACASAAHSRACLVP